MIELAALIIGATFVFAVVCLFLSWRAERIEKQKREEMKRNITDT